MKQFTKGIVSFLLAILLLAFPGNAAWEFLTKPETVDKKGKIISICVSYQQALPLTSSQITHLIGEEQFKIIEQVQVCIGQDSAYVDDIIVLISKTII